jgi:uncharacterized protein (TIGR03435 family)
LNCFLALVLAFQAPSFEVATIKATPPETRIIGDLFSYPGGRVLGIRCSLKQLVEESLQVRTWQVKGDLTWMRDEHFDIDARPPAASQSSKSTLKRVNLNDEQRQMLLALLVERFHLKYHRETREGPVYFLVRTKKPLRLSEPEHKDWHGWAGDPGNGVFGGGGVAGSNVSMTEFADRLSGSLERPVIDRTGIAGTYDFKAVYDAGDEHPDVTASILTSIQQLGLKLEPGKGPVETIVIDSAERPSGN